MMGTGDFNFPEFSTYTSPTLGTYGDSLGNLQSLPHAPESVYSPTSQHPPGYNAAGQPLPHLAEKRKGSEASGHQRLLAFNADEAARIAAEEDKRRRNTAASARFRIKKKQREQALERSAKEMTEKVTLLESRISQLETENKWLKNLITEKNGGDDITSQWREFKEQAAAKAAKESNAASSTASSSETSKPEADK